MIVRTRVASSTAARVWSENTTTSTSVPAAAIGASSGSVPTSRWRRTTIRVMGRMPASRAAIHIRPVGAAARVNAPIIMAVAAGSNRPVAIARSIEHQVSRAPSATIGSGRRPLL